MWRIIIWKILSQFQLEFSHVCGKQSSLLHFLSYCSFVQQLLVPKQRLLRKYFILYLVICFRWWNTSPTSVDLEYFCQINPPKTWTQHHTCMFWLPCIPESQKRVHWKILRLRIFTDSDQRSKEGKVTKQHHHRGAFHWKNGISSLLQFRLGTIF